MSLIIKVPGVSFTKPGLPKLYRDAVAGTGTKFIYDALNTVSWAKQAAPADGTPSADKLVNLVDGSLDGVIHSPSGAGSSIAWSNGFVSSDLSSSDKIVALNGSVPSASTKCVGIVWFKHGAQTTDGANNVIIANFADMLSISLATAAIASPPVADNRFYIGSSGSAVQELTNVGDATTKVGTVFQMAVAYDNSSKKMLGFVNGVLVTTRDGYQNMTAPVNPHTLFQRVAVSSGYKGTFYRFLFDDLSDGRSAAEIVARDYALNNGRFT